MPIWEKIEWMDLGELFLKVALILIGCRILVLIGRRLINKAFQIKSSHARFQPDEGRLKTLDKLMQNILRYTIYFVGVMMILSLFGVNTASLIASAGVLGLAVSFGAQNLVKDIITGFFVIFEDTYKVGDYVQIGSASGVVEEIGLRSSKIRSDSGELHIFPNGQVSTVVNYSRGAFQSIVSVGIAYEEDVERAIAVLREVCEKMKSHYPDKITKAVVLGVGNLGASDVSIDVAIYTPYPDRLSLRRELRKRCKLALDEAGIEIPYQKQVLYIQTQEEKEYAGTEGN